MYYYCIIALLPLQLLLLLLLSLFIITVAFKRCMMTKAFFHLSILLQTQRGAMTNIRTQIEEYLNFLWVDENGAARILAGAGGLRGLCF